MGGRIKISLDIILLIAMILLYFNLGELMRIQVIRTYHKNETQGVLHLWEGANIIFSALTLELPYRDNKRRISCIPEGEYSALKRYSPRFKIITFEIAEVPNRSAILFHAGNTTKDTQGCILVGTFLTRGFLSRSKIAFSKLMSHLEHFETVEVEVTSEQ